MMEIDANNIASLDADVEKNQETSKDLGNTNEKQVEGEVSGRNDL